MWGTGKPKREFLAADDLADACIFVMEHYSDEGFLNIGTGEEVSIGEFAQLVAEIVGYRGKLVFDTSRPDGPPRKLLTFLSFLRWAGLPRRRYAKVCERPTRIFLTKADKCVSDSKGVRRRPTWIGLSNRLILVSLHTRPQD
jgi:hypothetical protein